MTLASIRVQSLHLHWIEGLDWQTIETHLVYEEWPVELIAAVHEENQRLYPPVIEPEAFAGEWSEHPGFPPYEKFAIADESKAAIGSPMA